MEGMEGTEGTLQVKSDEVRPEITVAFLTAPAPELLCRLFCVRRRKLIKQLVSE